MLAWDSAIILSDSGGETVAKEREKSVNSSATTAKARKLCAHGRRGRCAACNSIDPSDFRQEVGRLEHAFEQIVKIET